EQHRPYSAWVNCAWKTVRSKGPSVPDAVMPRRRLTGSGGHPLARRPTTTITWAGLRHRVVTVMVRLDQFRTLVTLLCGGPRPILFSYRCFGRLHVATARPLDPGGDILGGNHHSSGRGVAPGSGCGVCGSLRWDARGLAGCELDG